jgi:hypothetical protein
MARTDWTALQTAPAAEYLAVTELERFGLNPYLPQFTRRYQPLPHAPFTFRRYPLFPRYLFLPLAQVRAQTLRLTRGLDRLRPVLSYRDGRIWRAPSVVIDQLQEAEVLGKFNENLAPGDSVTVTAGPCAGVHTVLTAAISADTVELFTPLFGGSRAVVSVKKVAHTHTQ